MKILNSDLPLERVYRWEKERKDDVYMTQPVGGGAVIDYTWGQTVDQARRMAAHLVSLGFPPGSRIAILSKNCAHFMLADLAIWMAGHVSVAIYPTVSAETIRYVLEHSEARLLFVGKLDTWEAQKSGVKADVKCIAFPLSPKTGFTGWDEIIKRTAPIAGSPTRAPDDSAAIFYTSGSTGQPKGVEHTFKSMTPTPKIISKLIDASPQDRMISYLPLAHVFERGAIEMLSFYVGIRVFFAESLDTFVEDIKRARPTVFHSVPRLWLKFQAGVYKKLPEKKLKRLLSIPLVGTLIRKKVLKGLGLDQARIAISGSAPIPPELIQWYRDLGLELLEGYAMTEDFICSHFSIPGRSRVGYVGNALEGVDVRLSEEGEILIRSPGCMKGYYKEPALTKESFTSDGYFKTGDRGEQDEQKRLKITGRVKELFKTSKGKYVAPAPIENLINANSHVELSCVTGAGLPQPVALLMLSEGLRAQLSSGQADRKAIEAALGELRNTVNAQIEEWEQLGCFVIVSDTWQIENGFLTPTLKLKRSAVEDSYEKKYSQWSESKSKVVWQQA